MEKKRVVHSTIELHCHFARFQIANKLRGNNLLSKYRSDNTFHVLRKKQKWKITNQHSFQMFLFLLSLFAPTSTSLLSNPIHCSDCLLARNAAPSFFPLLLSWFSMDFFTAATKRNRFNSSFSIHFPLSASPSRDSLLLLLFLLPVYLFFIRSLFFCDFFALHSGWCKTMRCDATSCVCVLYIMQATMYTYFFQHCHCVHEVCTVVAMKGCGHF